MSDNSNTVKINNTWFLYGDAIRIFATILVVILHGIGLFIYSYNDTANWWVLNIIDSFTRIAVPLFLCLSGALLLRQEKQESITVFYKKRMNKLLLPLLVWSIFYYLFSLKFDFHSINPGVFAHSFLQGTIYYHLPFVYYLLGIYLVMPLMRVFIRSAKKYEIELFLAIWFFSQIIQFGFSFFGVALFGKLFQIVGLIGYPIMGYYISTYRNKSKRLIVFLLSMWFFTAIITYYLSSLTRTLNETFYQYEAPNVIIMSFVVFSWFTNFDWTKLIESSKRFEKFFTRTSDLSLSIYFIHPALLAVFFKFSQNILPDFFSNPILFLLIIPILVFVVSWVIAYLLKYFSTITKQVKNRDSFL